MRLAQSFMLLAKAFFAQSCINLVHECPGIDPSILDSGFLALNSPIQCTEVEHVNEEKSHEGHDSPRSIVCNVFNRYITNNHKKTDAK